MERSKWSESAAVRFALELAIEEATPRVGDAVGAHRDAPFCTDLPRELVKMRNEPKRTSRQEHPPRTETHQNAPLCTPKTSSIQNEPKSRPPAPSGLGACTELHQNAPKRTTKTSNAQNEPNSPSTAPIDAPPDELSPRQLMAIALLFAGRSYSAVGRQLKINRSTLFRWRRSPAFVAEVRRRYQPSTDPHRQREAAAEEAARFRARRAISALMG